MTVKIFLTGATGYIGGTALAHIYKAHPDYEIAVLVRDKTRGTAIQSNYPKVKVIYGSLEDAAVLEEASAAADIVVHTADSADHVGAATAIARGLKKGHSAENTGFWIHTSGTGILTWYDHEHKRIGDAPLPEQTYHDIDDVDRLLTLPDAAYHRNVDKIVQVANSDVVRTAILSPPTIYGTGLGPVNKRSIQIPLLAKLTLSKGFAPVVGEGKTEWNHVHIDDLGDLFVKLVDATQDASKRNNPEIFGRHVYFFAENGSHLWSDIARRIAGEASRQGYLPEALTKPVDAKGLASVEGAIATLGCNSQTVAQRAAKYLGWRPKGASLRDTIAEAVAKEAEQLGLTPKGQKALSN